MADFDAQGYFDRRQVAVSEAPGKIAALEAAKAQKLQGMQAFKQARDASTAANQNALVNQLGLDPDGALGSIVNIGAAGVDGLGRIFKNAATAIPTIGMSVDNYGIPDEVRGAKSRMDGGIATPADLELLNQRTGADQSSYLEQLQAVEKKASRVKALNSILDTSGLVDKTNQDALTDELKTSAQPGLDQMKAGWKAFRASDAPGMPGGDVTVGTGDMLSGLAKALMTIPQAALSNPAAAFEFVSSNVPQLVAAGVGGAAGMAATNVPYAIDAYREGIAEYQKANKGAMPDQAWMETNAAKAASLLVAETVGDKLTLGAGKGFGAISDPAMKALDKGVDKISREAFKTAIQGVGAAVAPVSRVAGAAGRGGLGEFGTEAYQTGVEESIKGKDASIEDLFVGGAVGAISGGTASTSIAAVQETGDAAVKALTTALTSKPKAEADAPATLPESKELETLFTANQADATDPGARETNLTKAQELVGGMEQKIAAAKEALQVGAATSPEELADLQSTLTVVKEALAKVDPENTARVEQLTAAVGQLESSIAAADKATLPSRKAALDGQERELRKARTVLKTMTTQAATSTAAVDDTPQAATKKAVRSIVLSMAAVEGLSSEAATQMADDTALELSDKQRTYLRKFSEARVAENSMKDRNRVMDEMLNGNGGKNISIADYRNKIGLALSTKSQGRASQLLGLMGKFAADHTQKAVLARQLYKKALQDGKSTQMVSDGAGNWSVPATPLSLTDLRKNGGLTISTGSASLVDDIVTGSKALNLNLEQQEAAYDMTFDTKPGDVKAEVVTSAKAVIEKAKAVVVPKEEKPSEVPTSEDAPRASSPGGTVEATEVVAEDSLEAGTLDAFSKDAVDAEKAKTGYREMNLLSRYFKQAAGKVGSSTFRPIVAVKDFLSQWAAGKVSAVDSLTPEGEAAPELTAEQGQALKHFRKTASKWLPLITANLSGKTKQEFAHTDVMQFFLTQMPDGNGQVADMPENVKTAIALVAYQYVVELAGGTGFNTNAAMNQLIGKPKDNGFFTPQQEELRRAGMGEHQVQNSLGKAAMQALGIKPNKDAPQNISARVESALGAHAVKLLVDAGLLTVTTFEGPAWRGITGNDSIKDNEKIHFVKLSRDEDRKPSPEAEAMYTAQKGTQDILGKLFSVETRTPEPGFKPVAYVQTSPSNTNQAVPAKTIEIMKHENASANFLKLGSWNAVSLMSPENMGTIMGVQEIDETTVHIDNESSVLAKNASLENEYQTFMDYVKGVLANSEGKLKQAMYLSHVVWRNQRVGIEGLINPQTSKFHRFMLTRESWKSTVRLDNEDEMNSFMLRVAEGLGVKTENFQAQDALGEFMSKMDDQAIKAAVTALRKVVSNAELKELSEADQAAIVAGVATGGEKMHSFDALMALAQYQEAATNGEASFDTDMAGEIDGKTNGPMLSFLLLGAAHDAGKLYERVNQGGFYSVNDGVDQFSSWRSQVGNQDLYEGTSRALVQRLREDLSILPEGDTGAYGPVFHFIGQLLDDSAAAVKAGRNLVKTPITALAFGSSLNRAVESMADSFLESIYAKIEKVAKDGGDPAKTLEIIQNLNQLVPGWKLSESYTITDLMNMPIKMPQQIALRNVFIDTFEAPIKDTLKAEFGTFIAVRDSVNKTGELAFTVYEAAYKGLRQAYIARLVKEGKLEVDAKGKPVQDLSREQEAELRKELGNVVPTVDTAMSKGDKNRKAGMLLGKEKSRPSNDPTYKASVKFGTPFANKPNTGLKKGSESSTALGAAPNMEGPGVGTLVGQVHSSDSNISHSAAFMGEVLNVHDAHVTGLKTFTQTAKNLNKATWDTLLDYSPAQEILNTFGMTLVGVADMLKDPKVSDQVRATLLAGLTKYAKDKSTKKNVLTVDDLLENALNRAVATAHDSDQVRLETLSLMGAVDQYPALGGQYLPTDADRAEAAKRKAALKAEPALELVAAVKTIQDALAGRKVAEQVAAEPTIDVVPEVDETSEETNEPVSAADAVLVSQWGALGKPMVKPESDIEGIFDLETEMPASELARILYEVVSRRPSANNKFSLLLLKAIGKVLPANTRVRMVQPGTPSEQVQARPEGRSRGWFVSNPASPVLYVMSSDFVDSGMNAETLIHELVHAAVSSAIAQAEAGKATKEATELVNELGRLMKSARNYVEKNNLEVLFGAAVSNVDELVAWGMTNESFQKQVLNQIKMKDKNLANALVTGARAFYDALSRFFFGGVSPTAGKVMSTGMEVLMTNVSGLFAVAATTTAGNTEAKAAVLSMAAQADRTYNTKDIFHALGVSKISPVSAEFSVHLEELLDGMVFRLHGAFGSFKESLMKDQAVSPEDVFQKAKSTGKAPFASQSLASGFRISEQEAFVMEQVEVTVQEALDGNADGNMAYAVRGLRKLYEEARRSLTVKDFHAGDWATAQPAEQASAQALYDFVFKVEAGNGAYSNYLSRFAALGMAHEGFNKLLQGKALDKPPAALSTNTLSIANRIGAIVEQILQWFGEKMTRTYKGQPADSKLTTLVSQLVDIEGKRRNMLKNPERSGVMDQLNEVGEKAVEALNQKVVDFATSDFVQKSPSKMFKAGVTVARLIAEQRTDQLLEAMVAMRDKYSSGQLGLVFGTMKDAVGAPELFQRILRGTKNLERARKHVSTQTSKVMLEGFANKGKDLSAKAKQALANVILRTGAHVLLDHFDDNGIHKLLSNQAELTKAIAAWEAKLASYPKDVQKYYINQSKALGYSLVWGEARGPNMMMNAGNIASLYDTGRQGKVTPAEVAQATKDLDVLVTLYALSYSTKAELRRTAETLATEMARTDKQGNGVLTVMYGHKALEADARAKLFSGSEALMAKGYTSEIFNPYTEIVAEVEMTPGAQALIDAGYTESSPLKKDPQDPDKKVSRLYVRRGGGLSQHVTGAYSYTGKEAKGSTTHNGNTSIHNKAGRLNSVHLASMKAKKASAVDMLFAQDYDPSLDTEKRAAPVVDPTGKVVNYRYMMGTELKDSLLERENRFEVLMGAMAASSFDKQTATEQNTVATQALYDLYKVDYAKHPEAYLEVGPNSSDPELREIYRLLPYETQQAIGRIWGGNKMMVRNDLLDLSFGYRKIGMADLWDKAESQRNQVEFAFTWFAEHAVEIAARVSGKSPADAKQYAKRTQHIVQKSERMWLDLMKEVKDIIVVKTGTVMMGNILSNLTLLKLNGVSFADMVRHHKTATLGAKTWQQDSTELFRLQGELSSGYSTHTPAELQRQIRVLEDSMARNPVKTLIDAGLMPSIVEDVSVEDSPYTYKAQLARKVEDLTAGINPAVLNVGKQVYMTRDSVAYKTLSEITQLSDFVARYTLYMHLTTRDKDALSASAAIEKAADAFVSYDIPMHRKLQYLDDMGVMMFTKYFIRIQRVLVGLVRDNPTRVVGTLLLDQVVNIPSLVLDSSWIGRVGNNPLSSGAFQLPLLFDDLATVKAGLSLFK